MDFILPPVEPARPEWRGDTPFSADHDDSYFQPGQGPAESQAVFIGANDLAARFARLPANGVFVIGETGFGTGLNCLLAAECFAQHAPAGACLHLFSAERHPLGRDDLARALDRWPQLGMPAQALLEGYPPPAPGFHRIRLGPGIELTLMLGDALTLWCHSPAKVDAWFLDGFAPARNPDMWSPELFATIAEHSCPGATAAMFTAAGSVRRGLAAAGFEIQKKPGFGPKRHRLIARLPGTWQPQRTRSGRAIVAGAGLAGATTAHALAERGWQVTVCDPALDEQAPPSLTAVLHTSASAHLDSRNRFYLTAFLHARRWLIHHRFPEHDGQGRLEGVVQHLVDERVANKALQAIETGAWPEDVLTRIDSESVLIRGAGYLRPDPWIGTLLDHPAIETRNAAITSFSANAGVSVDLADGGRLDADALVLCTAGASGDLAGLEWLPLRHVRGQVTFCRATDASARWRRPHCHRGYLTPAIDGIHCFGATFDRQCHQPVIDPEDDRINIATLARALPDHYRELGGEKLEVLGHHAGVRCQAPDALPLAGPLPDPVHNPHRLVENVWLNIAHGARGLTHTPLCADLIADSLSRLPAALDTGIIETLAPERLIERKRRKQPEWRPEKGGAG